MKDFTLEIYSFLLHTLKNSKYEFQTFSDFIREPKEKVIILRHDVDDKKLNSLEFARIQNSLGISATYYFRILPQSFDEAVIKEIYNLGHEIGYHYEDIDFSKGEIEKAIVLFDKHLKKLREIVPISSLCMHGSPRSKFDNRDLWKQYDYRDFNLLGEPYFDVDFEKVYYATDTGRMWDGFKYSVRDFVSSEKEWPSFHRTTEIIEAIKNGDFPSQVMLTFHPQRWTNDKKEWRKELYSQKLKNIAKSAFYKKR